MPDPNTGQPSPEGTDTHFARGTLQNSLTYMGCSAPPKILQERASILELISTNEQLFRTGNGIDIRLRRGLDGAKHDVGVYNNASRGCIGNWNSTCAKLILGVDFKTDYGLDEGGAQRTTNHRCVSNLGVANTIAARRPFVFHLLTANNESVYICLLGADVRTMMNNGQSMHFSAQNMHNLATNNVTTYTHANSQVTTQIRNHTQLQVLQWLQAQYEAELAVAPALSLLQDYLLVNLPASDDSKVGFISLLNVYENVLKHLGMLSICLFVLFLAHHDMPLTYSFII